MFSLIVTLLITPNWKGERKSRPLLFEGQCYNKSNGWSAIYPTVKRRTVISFIWTMLKWVTSLKLCLLLNDSPSIQTPHNTLINDSSQYQSLLLMLLFLLCMLPHIACYHKNTVAVCWLFGSLSSLDLCCVPVFLLLSILISPNVLWRGYILVTCHLYKLLNGVWSLMQLVVGIS